MVKIMRKEIQRQEDKETRRQGDKEKKRLFLLLLVSLSPLLLVSFSTAFAQSGRKPQGQQGQSQGEKPMVRIETREVALPIIAYDSDGKYVNDLTPRDVLVLEEGEARQVTNVKRDPANIVLILDLANEIGTFKNGTTEHYG